MSNINKIKLYNVQSFQEKSAQTTLTLPTSITSSKYTYYIAEKYVNSQLDDMHGHKLCDAIEVNDSW